MDRDSRTLQWVTPARFVGPMMLIIAIGGGVAAVVLVMAEKANEAILSLLFTVCLLIVGIADLLGELIMLTEKNRQPPG